MMVKLFSMALVSIAVVSEANALNKAQQVEMVEVHNQHRSEVGVFSELTWSQELGDMAHFYANKLKNDRNCRMTHSDTKGVGENLYWAGAMRYSNGKRELQQITSKQVADAWASEKKYYNYSRNRCASGKVCGHYTQMIWANTSEIGCAKAVCADKSQVWVCNYYPAGNYIGKRPY
ncbi:CAP domain-containing protein [Solemya velum gill symbiont]|uniref:CAP domain-containing protein n=1 Tax=Solemya velum gill symbiont TaxID=2340 RepID=UPI000996F30B|nr:CAP domain-containing protein [Solemya velum gill symbiont]OOZ43957.1 hypothetical protein BOW37_08685 [Solemya velum gill symbiont]OOZ46692.1 hypothetical protein BOW38_06655 [Solemya velum gill symbiont]OOZ49134.1 hypothetical protein BOW39_07605 [Solemya velum gill symbiont]OOZ51502.1 hypothetical protein BOW40_07435 [Solemya velum gill symbiont]OOZ54115.1 hypothetical protein BOW41_07445 [Solemya velum gill symbiont]